MSKTLSLVEPQERLLPQYQELCREAYATAPHRYILHNPEGDFSHVLEGYRRAESGIGLPEGIVPSVTRWLMVGERMVGVGNIRLRLTPALENFGGHVGILIRPTERHKGLAHAFVPLLLDEAHRLGVDRILLTLRAANEGSRRICEKLNYLSREEDVTDADGERCPILRFWV